MILILVCLLFKKNLVVKFAYTALQERIAGAHVNINYQNTDKPVCFVLSFVAFVTQAKNSMKVSLQSIQP